MAATVSATTNPQVPKAPENKKEDAARFQKVAENTPRKTEPAARDKPAPTAHDKTSSAGGKTNPAAGESPDRSTGPTQQPASGDGADARRAKDMQQLEASAAGLHLRGLHGGKAEFLQAAGDVGNRAADVLRRGETDEAIERQAGAIKERLARNSEGKSILWNGRKIPLAAVASGIVDDAKTKVLNEPAEKRSLAVLGSDVLAAKAATETAGGAEERKRSEAAFIKAGEALRDRVVPELSESIAFARLTNVKNQDPGSDPEKRAGHQSRLEAARKQFETARNAPIPDDVTDPEIAAGVKALKERYDGMGFDNYFQDLGSRVAARRDAKDVPAKLLQEAARLHLRNAEKAAGEKPGPEATERVERARQQVEKAERGLFPDELTEAEITGAATNAKASEKNPAIHPVYDKVAGTLVDLKRKAETAKAELQAALGGARQTFSAELEKQKLDPKQADPVKAAFVQVLRSGMPQPAPRPADEETIHQGIEKLDPAAAALLDKADIHIRKTPLNIFEVTDKDGKPLDLTPDQRTLLANNEMLRLTKLLLTEKEFDAPTRALVMAATEARAADTETKVGELLKAGEDKEALAYLATSMKAAFSQQEADALWSQIGEKDPETGKPRFDKAYFDVKLQNYLDWDPHITDSSGNINPIFYSQNVAFFLKNSFGDMPRQAAGHLANSMMGQLSQRHVTSALSGDEFYSALSNVVEQAHDSDLTAKVAKWYTEVPDAKDRENSFKPFVDGHSWSRVAKEGSLALSGAIAERARKLAEQDKKWEKKAEHLEAALKDAARDALMDQVEELNKDIFARFEKDKAKTLQNYFDGFKQGRDVTQWTPLDDTAPASQKYAVRNMAGRLAGMTPVDQEAAKNGDNSKDWYGSGPQKLAADLIVRGLKQAAGPGGKFRGIPAWLSGRQVGAQSYAMGETEAADGTRKFIDIAALSNSLYANPDLIRTNAKTGEKELNFEPGETIDSKIFTDWHYAHFREFQEKNRHLPTEGEFHLPQAYADYLEDIRNGRPATDPKSLLSRIEGTDRVAYTLKPEQAAITTNVEWFKKGVFFGTAALATLGGGFLAYASGGATVAPTILGLSHLAVWAGMGVGLYTVYDEASHMAQHGQSTDFWRPLREGRHINPAMKGLYLNAGVQAVTFGSMTSLGIVSLASRELVTAGNLTMAQRTSNFFTRRLSGSRTAEIAGRVAPPLGHAAIGGNVYVGYEQTAVIIADINDPNGGKPLADKIEDYANALLNIAGMGGGIATYRSGVRSSVAQDHAKMAVALLRQEQAVPKGLGSFTFNGDEVRFRSAETNSWVTLRDRKGNIGKVRDDEVQPGFRAQIDEYLAKVDPDFDVNQLNRGRFTDEAKAWVKEVTPENVETLAHVEHNIPPLEQQGRYRGHVRSSRDMGLFERQKDIAQWDREDIRAIPESWFARPKPGPDAPHSKGASPEARPDFSKLTAEQWRHVRRGQIAQIPKDRMNEVPVENLSRDQFAGLNDEQLNAVETSRFANIDPRNITDPQYKDLHVDKFRAIPGEKLGLISKRLKGSLVRQVSDAQWVDIPPPAMSDVALQDASSHQIGLSTPEQIGYWRVRQIRDMLPEQLSAVSAEKLKYFTPQQRSGINETDLYNFSHEQRVAVTEPFLATEQGDVYLPSQRPFYGEAEARYDRSITRDQALANKADPEFLSRIHPDQLTEVLSPEDFQTLEPDGLAGLNLSHVSKLPSEYFDRLSDAQRSAMYPLQRLYVVRKRDAILKANKEQIARTHPQSIRYNLKPEDMPKVAAEGFGLEHAIWLTPEQAAALTDAQLEKMHPLVLGTFTQQTREAILKAHPNLSGRVKASLDYPLLPTRYGILSLAQNIPGPHNNFTPRMMTGHPQIYARSPIEDAILINPQRGARKLADRGGITSAARLLSSDKIETIGLVTGFNVDRHPRTGRIQPESDGLGTALAARDFVMAGKKVVIFTDAVNKPVLEKMFDTLDIPADKKQLLKIEQFEPDHARLENYDPASGKPLGYDPQARARQLLKEHKPDALIAIELPGRTSRSPGRRNPDDLEENDPGWGIRRSMFGLNKSYINQPLDTLMMAAKEVDQHTGERLVKYTGGIFDGGNEAGAGNVRRFVPRARNGKVMASDVEADFAIVADTSNIGAQALSALTLKFMGKRELVHTAEMQTRAFEVAAELGAIDGVDKKLGVAAVDGMSVKAWAGRHRLLMQALDHPSTQKPLRVVLMDSSSGGIVAAERLAWRLQQKMGRPVELIFALDHGNAPYGKKNPEQIAKLTNNVLKLGDELDADVIIMACNTACTAKGFKDGIETHVVNLVEETARAMREKGGRVILSLSTTATVAADAYHNAVLSGEEGKAFQQAGRKIYQMGASGIARNEKGEPIGKNGEVLPSYEKEGVPGLKYPHDLDAAKADLDHDWAHLVNITERAPPGEADTPEVRAYLAKVRAAVDHYVEKIPSNVTSVWLTCTHYPALSKLIQNAINRRTDWVDEHGNKADAPEVINPMEDQAEAAAKLLQAKGIERGAPESGQKIPSPPPIVVTSAGQLGDRFNPGEIAEQARQTLQRTDVRVVTTTFADDAAHRKQKAYEIRLRSLRPRYPDDGAIYPQLEYRGATTDENGVTRWNFEPIEPRIAQREYDYVQQLRDEGFDPTKAFEKIFENVEDYHRAMDEAERQKRPPSEGGPTPWRRFKDAARRDIETVAPGMAKIAIPSVAAAIALPVPMLQFFNGLAWAQRGVTSAMRAINPRWASKPSVAEGIKKADAVSFIENAYHTASLAGIPSGTMGFPHNPLYMVSNFFSGGALASGKPFPKWAKYAGFAAGNIANGLLFMNYAIPLGALVTIPTAMFALPTLYMTGRHALADAKITSAIAPTDRDVRAAAAITAAGLEGFVFGSYMAHNPLKAVQDQGNAEWERREKERRRALQAEIKTTPATHLTSAPASSEGPLPPSLEPPALQPAPYSRSTEAREPKSVVPRQGLNVRLDPSTTSSDPSRKDNRKGALEQGSVVVPTGRPVATDKQNNRWTEVTGAMPKGVVTGWVRADMLRAPRDPSPRHAPRRSGLAGDETREAGVVEPTQPVPVKAFLRRFS